MFSMPDEFQKLKENGLEAKPRDKFLELFFQGAGVTDAQRFVHQYIRLDIELTEFQMLIDKNEFQCRNQLFQFIDDIEYLDAFLDQVIGAARKLTGQQVVQCRGQVIDMNERSRLLAVALDRNHLIEVGFKDKLVDHGVEAHALAVSVNISAAKNIGVNLVHEPSDVLFAAILGDGVEGLRMRRRLLIYFFF
jgi:hypothetical protein